MRLLPRKLIVASALVLLCGCASLERLAIPDKHLLDPGLSKSGAATAVDHTAWDDFLSAYTEETDTGEVRVSYAAVTSADRQRLQGYLSALSSLDATRLSKDAQLAYWSNLYNAQTVAIVLDHYPVSSIRKIKDGIFDLGPWDNKTLTVNGRPLSLHEIEHGIVRPLWADTPEIHYLLNCAAAGCPNLSRTAYTAENVRTRMSQAAAAYINDPRRGVRVDRHGRVTISKIYLWYREDFGDSEAGILDHLRRYASPGLASQLRTSGNIDGYFYDWTLNIAAP